LRDFTGEDGINLPGVNMIGNQDTRGNVATATRLQNNIKIGGIPFDGTTSIDLPGVNTTGRVGSYGIALNAIGLYYKPTIGGGNV